MRKTEILAATINPQMSEGLSPRATAMIYGGAAVATWLICQYYWPAGFLPFLAAIGAHIFVKMKTKEDVYYFVIKDVYDTTADVYHPWPEEDLGTWGRRPKGYGRGIRC